MANNNTNDKIKSGQGLSPLPSSQPSNTTGIITEQRGEDPGIRRDSFTREDERGKK